jgi:5-bromo-4-chloroindolyl phosphate hydrolysis protein
MKQNMYFKACISCVILGVAFMAAVESHFLFSIMAIVAMGFAAYFSEMWMQEKLKHLRSNADQDRPE